MFPFGKDTSNLTPQEKIDFIYKKLKRQDDYEKARFAFKIVYYLVILYFIFIYIPNLIEQKIQEIKQSVPGYELIKDTTPKVKDGIDTLKNMFFGEKDTKQDFDF